MDNNPLPYIFSSANLDAAGQRWVAQLASYNFALEYQKGKDNTESFGQPPSPRQSPGLFEQDPISRGQSSPGQCHYAFNQKGQTGSEA